MQEDVLIRVTELYRYYDTHCAVDNLSFEVHRGEVLGFLGPNGAGKSTTMRMLTGNLAPSNGQVQIDGIDLLDEPKRAKAKIGYLPEQPPLYRDATVNEYLHFCARLNRIPRDAVEQAVATAMQRCGLTDVGRRLIANLSKGYQQRVGIAQAIVHSPDVVILDEPTVGLDPIQIREIRHLIRELGGEHSVVLSTHILPEVQATCDRVQIINKGRLIYTDSVAALSQSMQSASLMLGLRNPPTLDALRAIAGVESVESAAENQFLIAFKPEQDPREALVKLAVEKDWGLFELSPQRRSLEDIFVDLTTNESDDEEAAA